MRTKDAYINYMKTLFPQIKNVVVLDQNPFPPKLKTQLDRSQKSHRFFIQQQLYRSVSLRSSYSAPTSLTSSLRRSPPPPSTRCAAANPSKQPSLEFPIQGCEGSILLVASSSFTGEKNAFLNQNSARGFDVIDAVKDKV